jgi:hypothetical protein
MYPLVKFIQIEKKKWTISSMKHHKARGNWHPNV